MTDTVALLLASDKFTPFWRPESKPSVDSSGRVIERSNIMTDKHWTVNEVAERWGVSVDLIRDVFKDEDGVLIFERPGTRTKRSYSTMRIPESVLERVYSKLSKR